MAHIPLDLLSFYKPVAGYGTECIKTFLKYYTHTHTHTHFILMAIFSGESGLASYHLNSHSPLIPKLCMFLGDT